ncbi:MAG: bifunctional phosphoribosylaminoimidazolecarboxamide formyltransferase/IMP cyclohydrolase [Gammaproteobacteria bacterium]|nr:bifunctional phosphoribosylaminoimidazolecarboxamide formyltransferase/IMP cyclohydrolase [Gammaproteobacteria bacterium]
MTAYKRALISVSDKTGVEIIAKALIEKDIEILSTGGTAKALRAAGLDVTDVSDVTGFPEIMDGRVKTLHPKIHGGILARRDQDAEVMAEQGIGPIDLLIVNLYPFESTVAQQDCTYDDAIENIDIGGPAMLRAAAKNHKFVTVIVDPADYDNVIQELSDNNGTVSFATRQLLAKKAFGHTAAYDAAIWNYLDSLNDEPREFGETFPLPLRKHSEMRYGENPHQRAALYSLPQAKTGTLIAAKQHQGKPLSYNNIADADAALECVKALTGNACVIVKHANPCGVAIAATPLQAYDKAFKTDPNSAFGGIIAVNTEVDGALASEIVERQFLEVMVAPAYTAEALAEFAKKPNIRVLDTGPLNPTAAGLRVQQIEGGILVQDKDLLALDHSMLKVVTERQPTEQELADAVLAWELARFVKSNAIIYCQDGMSLGIGAGQMSRVMSARIAAWKAEEAGLPIKGAAMASDAFFPFRDGIDIAAEYGIGVVIQPGGSIRDDEVIAAANEHNMVMLFTGARHFRH